MATLSKDGTSWHARSIERRDFRHDPHAVPEIPRHKSGGVKGGWKKRSKKTPTQKKCKHVWVEVSWREFYIYALNRPWWYLGDTEWEPWKFTTYFVCPECLATKQKENKGAYRSYVRKSWRRRNQVVSAD